MGESQRDEGTMMITSGSTPILSPLQKSADIVAHGIGIGEVELCHLNNSKIGLNSHGGTQNSPVCDGHNIPSSKHFSSFMPRTESKESAAMDDGLKSNQNFLFETLEEKGSRKGKGGFRIFGVKL